jgi:hypothetical protein
VRRRKLSHSRKNGSRIRDVSQREVLLDGPRIELAPYAGVHEQCFELGPEDDVAVVEERVEQRLDAQTVAGEEKCLPIAVPQRESEHAAKAFDAALAPRLPCVDDDFRVAQRAEDVAERDELGNQRLVVVDLAVEDDADAAVLVVQRLLPGRHAMIDSRR